MATLLALCLTWSISHSLAAMQQVSETDGFGHWLGHFVGLGFADAAIIAVIMAVPLTVVGNLAPPAGRRRYAALALALALLAPVAALERWANLAWTADEPFTFPYQSAFVTLCLRYAEFAALAVVIVEFNRHERQNVEAMHAAVVDQLALEREMDEARLQVLQAQIEPHFLFNTLANVRRLYHTDLSAGRTMLDNLMRYLEVALPQMRASESDLQRELALVESYLAVQQIRMGERLSYTIDVPQGLRRAALPTMMLLTLVENAIKHGLNPLPEGGNIAISARAQGSAIELRVVDTGRGFVETSGGGTGLANIQARLTALYGNAASLELADNEPRGVVSTLRWPKAMVAA